MTQRDWRAHDGHVLGAFLNGAELHERTRDGEPKYDDSFLAFFNAHFEDVTFRLPSRVVRAPLDARALDRGPGAEAGSRTYAARDEVVVVARSVLLMRASRPRADRLRRSPCGRVGLGRVVALAVLLADRRLHGDASPRTAGASLGGAAALMGPRRTAGAGGGEGSCVDRPRPVRLRRPIGRREPAGRGR